jgi:hypothetical protein
METKEKEKIINIIDKELIMRERSDDIKLETTYCANCGYNHYNNIGSKTCVNCGKNK